MYCNSRRANFWSWRVNLICLFLLRFQDEVSFPVGGVVIHILHLLCLSRESLFPGLSTEPSSHYGEHLINAKKNKVKYDLAGMGRHPKGLWFGLYSLHKESEQISRLQCETKQSCSVPMERDVELENVNRCGDILMHLWKDKWLSCCYILEFTPSPYQKYDAKSNSHFILISQSV